MQLILNYDPEVVSTFGELSTPHSHGSELWKEKNYSIYLTWKQLTLNHGFSPKYLLKGLQTL